MAYDSSVLGFCCCCEQNLYGFVYEALSVNVAGWWCQIGGDGDAGWGRRGSVILLYNVGVLQHMGMLESVQQEKKKILVSNKQFIPNNILVM